MTGPAIFATKPARNGFTKFPNWRWEDPELSDRALILMGWLTSHMDQYRVEKVGIGEIRRRLGWGQRKAEGALNDCEAAGLVRVHGRGERTGDGQWRQFRIEVNLGAWEDGQPDSWTADRVRETTTPPVTESRTPPIRDSRTHRRTTRNSYENNTPSPAPENSGYANEPAQASDQTQGQLVHVEAQPAIVEPDGVAFEAFWEMYPRKAGKAAAKRRWDKMTVDERTQAYEFLIDVLPAWEAKIRQDGSTKFVAHGSTWLNQCRWEDDPSEYMPVKAARKEAGGLGALRARLEALDSEDES